MGETYAAQVIDEGDRESKPRQSFWKELPILLGVAIVVAVLVRSFIIQTFYIPSESMENTLLVNDRVLVNKLVYDFRDPHRGEIIVFNAPQSWRTNPNEKDFIKRVIGVGGDHVVCCDASQRITVNGTPLNETYLFRDASGRADLPSENSFDVVVPQGRLWVMGDHRSDSGDSAMNYLTHQHDLNQATIPVDSVVGRAFLLFWPLSRWDWLSVPDTFNGVAQPSGH
jgi:signal peptidase I